MIRERSKEQQHSVRVIPTIGGDWIAACSDCDFEVTTHLKIDCKLEADMHANPHRQTDDGGPKKSLGQIRRERRARAERRKQR